MLKVIFTSLILWQTAFSSDTLSYTQKKYSSGADYIRLTIPESSKNWTCFDESLYGQVIDNAYQIPIKDSLISLTNKQLTLCYDRESAYEKQVNFLKVNEASLKTMSDIILKSRDACEQDLKEEKFQKWVWGGMGTLLGVVAGGLTILVLQR